MALTDKEFSPPALIRQPDIQNLLSSLGLRHGFLRRRTATLNANTKPIILDGGDGVRLSGELTLTPQGSDSRLAILIHGWEGCSQSAYMISAALALYEAGFSVCRLNLRDHGSSHNLNEGIFNSTLLPEVSNAINDIQSRWPHTHYCLGGYSLGGNFALRIALSAPNYAVPLAKVVAVCPVIDPAHTLQALQNAIFLYEHYFVRRWRNSLLKKLDHFPHYNYGDELRQLNDLESMHEFFVPRFTPFETPAQYFSAYTISQQQLAELKISTHLINSQDDPITKAEILPDNTSNPQLTITRPRYGSHCAFLQDFRMTSWVDEQLVSLFLSATTTLAPSNT